MQDLMDLLIVAGIAVLWPVWENAIAWPRFLRNVSGGDAGVRATAYRRGIATQWALSAFVALAWTLRGHAWSALPLYSPVPWRIGVGVVLAAGLIVLMAQQVAAVRRSPEARASIRRQIGDLEPMLPRTREELSAFMGLSVTAGVCEEWLFRGALTTLLAGWVGLPLAVLVASVAFGFGHAYQGPVGIAKTAGVGLVMSGIVLASGSLLPAMIVHATIDIGSGLATHIALTTVEDAPVDSEPGPGGPDAGPGGA